MPYFLSVSVAIVLSIQQTSPPPDLVQSVERQRGGRHWIDQPTDPPKTAQESQACFQLEPGYRIELVAEEPIVLDPVAVDFDDRGRMFVAEYGDYPVGPKDPAAAPLSRIVLVEDTDRDGRMDRRMVFADHIRFCHSVMAFRNGILTCSDTEIIFLADTDGDRVADVREVWFTGFVPPHPQMQIGCPRWGFDNWIYLTYGNGKVKCVRPGFESPEVEIPRMDFRFHPDTMQFEAVSGAGQFGNTIDNFGRRYFSSNRNPIMTDVLSLELVRKNPLAGIGAGHTDVGPSGEKTQVFPLVAMKSNWLSHAGTHTSACGVTAYRGGLFGAESDRSVFVCEPVGHLITRSVVEKLGGTVTARRAREKADFLASTDTWFRPVGMATGPEGGLYVADMYRLWVEHPKFVPDDVAARMDWRAGEDRGRIWRILPETNSVAPAFQPPTTTEDRVRLLRHPNGWCRMLGQRTLVENQCVDAEAALRKLLTEKTDELSPPAGFSRLHALWTLYGLKCVTPHDLIVAAADADPVVRRDAAVMTRLLNIRDPQVRTVCASLCGDPDGEVRMQAILALDPASPLTKPALLNTVSMNVDDVWLQRAMLITAPAFSGELAEAVVDISRGLSAGPESAAVMDRRKDFLRMLALNAGADGNPEQIGRIADVAGSVPERGLWWQTALAVGLAEGLPRGRSAEIPKGLAALLESPPAGLRDRTGPLREIVQQASAVAVDRSRSDEDRVSAMGLMPYLPAEALTETLNTLLKPGESTACQRAAVEAARRSGRPEFAAVILERWEQLNPQARSAALDLLLLRKESIAALLKTMAAGTIAPSVISIDQRLILLQHQDTAIRSEAVSLFGGNVSSNRREVASQYSKALELQGDAARGAQVFEKTCSKCHRINSAGHNVGPDISDTRARARDALLYDIIDPNRRVDPQYSEYIVVTADGRQLNGLMIAETSESVTLRQPEGREQTIPRAEIDDLKSTARSLMPEGIERDVSVEQMADLLEFLKAR